MRSILLGIFTGVLILGTSSLARAEGGPVVSVEGFGGFTLYYEDCCDGPGWTAGGAVNVTSEQGIGFRAQVDFHRSGVDVFGANVDTDALFITGNLYAEAGSPEDGFGGYGYLGSGWGKLSASLIGFSVDGTGGIFQLGGGLKFYLNENVYLTPAIALQRGFGDIESVHFSITGGLGATFH